MLEVLLVGCTLLDMGNETLLAISITNVLSLAGWSRSKDYLFCAALHQSPISFK